MCDRPGRILLEFKAGKMSLEGKMVYPDKRKGMAFIYQTDDSLVHFCWKDRLSGIVEVDLITFPGDCEYKYVPQCTTGRVYLLKFVSTTDKFFLWLQESTTDDDDENCLRINYIMNSPPALPRSFNTTNINEDVLGNVLDELYHQDVMQMLRRVQPTSNLDTLFGSLRHGCFLSLTHFQKPKSAKIMKRKNTNSNSGSNRIVIIRTLPSIKKVIATSAENEEIRFTTEIQVQSFLSICGLSDTLTKNEKPPGEIVDYIPVVDMNNLQNDNENIGVMNQLTPQQHLPTAESASISLQESDSTSDTIIASQFTEVISISNNDLQNGKSKSQQLDLVNEVINVVNEENIKEFAEVVQGTITEESDDICQEIQKNIDISNDIEDDIELK